MLLENLARWSLLLVVIYYLAMYVLAFFGIDIFWGVLVNNDTMLALFVVSLLCYVLFPLDLWKIVKIIKSDKVRHVIKFSQNVRREYVLIAFTIVGLMLLLNTQPFIFTWWTGCLFTVIGMVAIFVPTKYTL